VRPDQSRSRRNGVLMPRSGRSGAGKRHWAIGTHIILGDGRRKPRAARCSSRRDREGSCRKCSAASTAATTRSRRPSSRNGWPMPDSAPWSSSP
jgi:hypothetical protein